MTAGDDPEAARRWTRDRFEGDVLEFADVFRLARPPGWTVTGTAGERYALRPPPSGPAIDVDISLVPRPRVPAHIGVVEYLQMFVALEDDPVEDLAVETDVFGRRASGRWFAGLEAGSAVVVATASHYVLVSARGQRDDHAGSTEMERVLAAFEPLS